MKNNSAYEEGRAAFTTGAECPYPPSIDATSMDDLDNLNQDRVSWFVGFLDAKYNKEVENRIVSLTR